MIETNLPSVSGECKNITRIRGVIYLITNTINGKVYVGQTRRTLHRRWSEHKRDMWKFDVPLYRSMRKYGIENFTIRMLECIGRDSEFELVEALNMFEQNAIKKHNSMIDFGIGYNLTTGGDVCLMSEYARDKMSKAKMGFSPSKSTRDKIRKSLEGRPLSENTRRLLSLANGGVNHPNYGKHRSLATKLAIRKSHLGKILSEEVRNHMSDIYHIIFSGGRIEVVTGLKRFCNSRGYDRKNIYRVMVGLQSYHKDIIGVKNIE